MVDKVIENLKIEKIVPGGDGLIRHEGRVIFVPGVLPGEVVDIRLTEIRKRFCRADVLQIHKPSPGRVSPVCPLYGQCGGCNLQHLEYGRQLEAKEGFVREHFRRIAGMELPGEFRFHPSDPYGYRSRIQIHCDGSNRGFRKKGSSDIISVPRCPVLTDSLNSWLSGSDDYAGGRKVLFGTAQDVYAEGDNREIRIPLAGKEIAFRADLFFQSNLSVLPHLIDYALDGAEGERAMDLYCGVGLFSLFLADRFRKLTAIELNPDTEEFYRNNLSGQDADYYGMSLEDWLKRKGRKREKMDLIVVDPPRTGLSAPVRRFLTECPAESLVYVSCDPATQARDTAELMKGGYEPVAARGFDFYPQTHHMETVLRFRRKK